MLWVPSARRLEVWESEHDSKVAGYMGQDKQKSLYKEIFGGLG
jgi:hypothetical protein